MIQKYALQKWDSGFILGTAGSGKSYAVKQNITKILLNTNDDVIIIDPEREYTQLARYLEGEVVHIAEGSKDHINPLDMTTNYDEDPFTLKTGFVLTLCECLVGRSALSSEEKTIIGRCLNLTYAEYLYSFDKSKTPTLLDFQAVLESQNEPAAKDLIRTLEFYKSDGLSVFSKQTNVDLKRRLVVYDTKDIGENFEVPGTLIVLDSIWNRIMENRSIGKRTWIYLEGVSPLLANDYTANFLLQLYKRSRMLQCTPIAITQNVRELFELKIGRGMLANSKFLLILNLSPSDRAKLAELLNVPETQLSYVANSAPGEGLICTSMTNG